MSQEEYLKKLGDAMKLLGQEEMGIAVDRILENMVEEIKKEREEE